MRLLGFLLGTLLGAGLVAAGLWWLSADSRTAPGDSMDAVAGTGTNARSAHPAVEPQSAQLVAAAAANAIAPLTPEELQLPPRRSAASRLQTQTPTAPAIPAPESTAATESPAAPEPPVSQTYTLWRPFNSHSAAQGFAKQIQERSGYAVQVRQQGEQSFEVVLRYRDEQELATMVRVIEDATRLHIR